MIASLPMYDRRETADANDRLWAAIRARLGDGPKTLTRGGDVWAQWRDPALVLSQTCGYPYRAELADDVTYVGTPVYDIDCAAGHYFSVFVVRADDPRSSLREFADARFAYNEAMSQSGWAAPQTHASDLGFVFSNSVKSGAHLASAQMVAEGRADIAALDAVSWRLMTRWDEFANNLRVLNTTIPTPALPLITALGRDPAPLRIAIEDAIASLSASDVTNLCLTGLTKIDKSSYLAVPTPASP